LIFYYCTHTVVRALLRYGMGLTVQGHEHVPGAGGAILAANHVSALDPVVVGAAVRRPVWFMAKEELFRRRGLGALLRALHAFPVRRDRTEISTVKRTLALLGQGKLVLMVPEGTRHDGITLGAIRPGVAVLAARARVPVVPVYHDGAGRMLPRGARWPRRHALTVRFGPPVHPSPAVLSEGAATRAFGEQLLQQWDLLRARAAGDGPQHQLGRAAAPAPRPREEGRPA
jgi:1-acyl-sn-glycerol-3-phosphate acyltransferase